MSERTAQANSDSGDFTPLNTEQNKDDINVAHLQDKISKLEKQRDEDRFIFLTVFVIFFNIIVLEKVSWASAAAVLILQLFLLVAAGRRLKVKYMEYVLEKVLDFRKHPHPPSTPDK